MMLLVRGEDEVVQHLAARDSGVVAQDRVNEACTIFQVAVVAQHETGGHYGIENTATIPGHTIHQDDPFTDLRRLLFRRVDGDIFQFAGPFDITMRSNLGIFQNPAVLDDARFANSAVISTVEVDAGLGDFLEAFLQLGVVGIFRPKVGIGRDHAIKRQDFTAPDFVHHLKPHTHIFGLAFLDGAVAEFGVVGGRDFLNVEEDTSIANDVVGHVMHIVDGHIIADVARNDAAVGNTDRHTKVVILQHLTVDATDAHHAEEMVVVHHVGIELVRHPNVVPIGG